MISSLLTICICGGGNLGHTIAGYVAAKSDFNVNILTSNPHLWAQSLEIDDCLGKSFHGKLSVISNDPAKVIPQSDIILLCLPGFAIEDELLKINPFLTKGQTVGSVVSSTGFFFIAQALLSESIGIFGFHRVPFIARTNIYGHSASLLGYKKELKIAIEHVEYHEDLVHTLTKMLDTPITLAHHHLEVSLSNSNPLLHTTRLYSLFGNYQEGMFYDQIPFFYEDWEDRTSELLIACDKEFFEIINKLPINSNSIESLLSYYECINSHSLTMKIRSIEAFKSLKAPLKQTCNGLYIPDFTHRYFNEDFAFGLAIIKQLGVITGTYTPNIDVVLEWGNKFIPMKDNHLDIRV